MKIDILFLEKYFVSKFGKISDVFYSFTNNKILYIKSKKSELSHSLVNQLSRSEKYQNVSDKVKQLKSDQLKQKKSNKQKKSKKTKESTSLINQVLSSEKYQNFIEKFKQLKNNKSPQISLSHFVKKSKYLEKFKQFKLFDYNSTSKSKGKNKKFDQKIGIIFYGDHNLILLSLLIDLKNRVQINGVTELPIPGNVIGDSLVEDSNELANIALDSLNLLDLTTSPLLVVLSSTFFNIHSFQASDLKQISQSDSKVQSKSPYLPANTLVDFLRIIWIYRHY